MRGLLKFYNEKKINEDILMAGAELFFLCQSNNCPMIASFAESCIVGEFRRRTEKNLTECVNRISDFYVGSRVRFRGKKEVRRLMNRLIKLFDELYPIKMKCKDCGRLIDKLYKGEKICSRCAIGFDMVRR